jgi:hypothetical protein
MRVTAETVREAIATYAVMLNRPQWLDESKMLLQEQVWRRLIERADGDTNLHIEHVELAIEGLIKDPEITDYSINPVAIVGRAAHEAGLEECQLTPMFEAVAAGTNPLRATVAHADATGDTGPLVRAVTMAITYAARSGREPDEIQRFVNHLIGIRDHIVAAYPELAP